MNSYTYVNGNPVQFVDLTGQVAFIAAIPFLGGGAATAGTGTGLSTLMSLVGIGVLANTIGGDKQKDDSKKGVPEWNKNLPIQPGMYTCRYVMYFPEDQCKSGQCPPFVTGRGWNATLAGAMLQARTEAQSKIPKQCSHQHHGQMWCREGGSPPFMPGK